MYTPDKLTGSRNNRCQNHRAKAEVHFNSLSKIQELRLLCTLNLPRHFIGRRSAVFFRLKSLGATQANRQTICVCGGVRGCTSFQTNINLAAWMRISSDGISSSAGLTSLRTSSAPAPVLFPNRIFNLQFPKNLFCLSHMSVPTLRMKILELSNTKITFEQYSLRNGEHNHTLNRLS